MKKISYVLYFIALFTLTACVGNPSSVTFSAKEIKDADIHTAAQNNFWADKDYESSLLAYGMGEETLDQPVAVNLSWKVDTAKKYLVKISENEDLSNPWEFETKKQKLDVYNLKTGTKYYYSITAYYQKNEFTSETFSFTTKSGGPRNIVIDGVANIRDIGGYSLENGKTIKQGLIYRSGKLNESDVKDVKLTITSKGIKVMNDYLKIKTEIDLRKTEEKDGAKEIGGLTSSPLGDQVNYVNCPMYYEGSSVISHSSKVKREANQASIKKMFDLMSDINNYPVVFHCTQGKDRTGALAYLMETLLGANKDDIYHDYLFTNMSKVGGYCNYSQFEKYEDVLRTYGGETLQEQSYNYLLKIGVSEDNINSFINIMTN